MAKKIFSYNDAVDELEMILNQIENESLDVDQLTEKVKRAGYLIKECKKRLKTTEDEVNKILENFDNE
ncbi:MAG TPA: exodeoxyribonuclease VII small subunit [Bacteroidales bacterium]|jgi:exodeoxyribonuclease VII small subunit|nr:exodeoxyribonuclease VII small subunit [Bacteroidales bacterium]MDD4236118.1 exodeoxyribonuclease VII small subunit [Bacteroidales bacterium]HXK81324.1 exodeoxyribonuclease VII small subunit [Bacteroidales bacterium]